MQQVLQMGSQLVQLSYRSFWLLLLSLTLVVSGLAPGQAHASSGGTDSRANYRVAKIANTVLSETFEAGNSFTLVNGSAANNWVRGTAAGGAANALYVSNDGGATHAYSGTANNQRSQVHAYTDVTIAPGQTYITLSFDWKNTGENNFDYLRLSYAPTTFTPSAVSNSGLTVGTPISGAGTGSPTILADNLNGQSAFTNRSVVLPASLAGTSVRLIFSWINDGSLVANPPAAIDNVLLTALVPTPLCGIQSVGPGGDFTSLTSAFGAISANGLCGPIVLELLSNYASNVEGFPLVFNYTGTTSTNTVTVRPRAGATGLSISSAASQTFAISGGRHFILDGRPGGSGTPVSGAAAATDLTIANTSTTGIPLHFAADASFNTVQHCQVRGVGSSLSYPDVNFSSTVTTTGNSDNTIRYNTIGNGATTPTTLVYSGSSSNARNTIEGNELQNFYNSGGDAHGIYLSAAGADWALRNNSLYWTAPRSGVMASILYGIYIASGSSACVIQGNFIGGSAANCGGTPFTVSGGTVSYRFRGISLAGSGTAASIDNNTIDNFAWLSSSGATTAPGVWAGMYLLSNATVTDNTFGSAANGVLVTSSTGGGISYGIVSSAGPSALTIARNIFANLTAAGTTTTVPVSFAAIQTAGTATTIARNRIYDVRAGNNGVATGIIAFGGSNTISNNLIGDLNAPTSNSLLGVSGITVSGGTAANIYYNTIYLNASSTAATFGNSGIYLSSTTPVVELRNNIVVNASTPAGSGLAVALRRTSTALTGYASSSNNNLYYAGIPTSTRLLYYDGTNADQTLSAFKARVAPRETASVAEDVPFASTNGTDAAFLHINPSVPTVVESGGTAIADQTDDIDAAGTRPAGGYPLPGQTNGGGAAPDLGADEGDFTPQPRVDVGIVALTAPAATQTCYSTTETVTAALQNFASTPLNFAANPVTVTGTITAPGFTTITLPTVTLNSGTLAPNTTLNVTFPGTYDLSAPNTYTFNITASAAADVDATNNALPASPAGTNTRTVQPLAAGTASASPAALCGTSSTTLMLTGSTGGNVQWQSSTDNLTFANISGATGTPYTTAPVSQTTYFQAVVSCNGNTQTSNVVTVTVSNPQITSVNAPTRCGAGTVTLQATATTGDTPYYYTTATGGAPIASGSSATVTVSATPATQTFYVEARNGTLNVAGEQSSSSAPSGSVFQQSTFTDYPIGFNVATAGTLSTVDVYPTAAGTLTIRLYTATNPGAGTAVAGSDRTFTISAAQVGTRVTLPLNYSLAAGGYKLGNAVGGLGRYSTYTGTYPITNGALSVVGSYNFSTSTGYTNTTYNSFFNLAFAPGGAGCASAPRTAINVTVTPPPALTPATTSQSICSGGSTSVTYSGYTNISVSPAAGATVSGQTVTFNPTTTTTYTITGTDGNGPSGCTATATATISVNPAPAAPTLTPSAPGPICVGSSTTVTVASNTSNQPNRTILAATFDSGADGFTSTSTGSQANSGFTRVAAGYLRGTAATPYNGPSGAATGGYYIADSDKYGTGATAPSTQTTLVSPVFSTLYYTAATLSFQQYYRRVNSDVFVGVEYSTNGSTWTSLDTYNNTQGNGTGAEVATTIALPAAALNQGTVQVRFRYQTDDGWYWALDNVSVTGTLTDVPTFAVTPTAGATISGSTITFNPTATTTYSVTASYPSSGCTSPATPVTITVNPRPTATFSSTTAQCSGSNATLTGTLTGTAPFTGQYTVNGGTPQPLTISGNTFTIATGTLTTTATYAISALSDANCSASTLPAASQTVVVNPRPSFTITNVTNVNCSGSSTGSISVAASGGLSPYRYSKDNGATYQVSSTFTGLAAGTYQILVRSNSGALCPAATSQSVTITQPPTGVTVSETHTNVSCTNANDGTITATGAQGAGPYRYSIDNGTTFLPTMPTATPYTFTGLAAGSYTVLVLDANGCTASTPAVLVTTNPRPTAALTNNGPLCAGNPAMVTITLTGTAPWNLTYTDGSTTTTVPGITTSPYIITVPLVLNTTTYSVTSLTDANCTGAGSGLGSTTITVNTTTTWTGAASSGNETDWFNSSNWTNCVPTRFVNAVIPNGVVSYPELVTTATAEVNTLIVNNGASLYQSAGQLHIYGNLNNSGNLELAPVDGLTGNRIGGTLVFQGNSPHMINGLSAVLHLTFNTGSVTTTLNTNLSVYGSLTMTSGLLSTGTNIISLRDEADGPFSTAPLTETESSYVLGRVAAIRDLSTPGVADSFSGLGLTLTPALASTTLPGITQVTRTTGTAVLGANNHQSILRQFRIIPQNDDDLNVTMGFGYFNHERNGIADANLMLFSRDIAATGATPWMYYTSSLGTATPPNGTSEGTVTLNNVATLLQDWTLGSNLTPLPVELTRFEARRQGDQTELSWSTASEKNNRGFEVQVSANGRNFRALHFVEPASPNSTGPRSYSYTDREGGKTGLRYYRLRQIDLNGQASFSPVRTVLFDQPAASLSAAPNPFSSQLLVSIEVPKAQAATLILTDLAGRQVLEQKVQLQAGQTRVELTGLSNLTTGVYLLRLRHSGLPQAIKVVKE